MKSTILHSTLDAFVLAAFTLLMIPMLLFGFSPAYLLVFHILLSFLYYILKDRNKKELAIGLVLWPIALVSLSLVFNFLFFIQIEEVLLWWTSVPGLVLFIATVLAAVSAFIMTKVVMTETRESVYNEL